MTEPGLAEAFAPGRVNLIGEHTDYNRGLALAFAVPMGVTVTAVCGTAVTDGVPPLVQGAFAELRRAGVSVPDASVAIAADLPAGVGLSSSAAVCVATVLALVELAGVRPPPALELAQLCQRIEHSLGVQSGLLDQLAVLLGRPGEATLIDFATFETRQVPVDLCGGRLALLDSGERRDLASSGYNQRRAECRAGLAPRMRHVDSENARVLAFADAMGDPVTLGRLLNESHASLRDDFEVSTPAVEATVRAALRAGAFGARIMGGGFGGSVLALFPGDARRPDGAVEVEPAGGARVL
jgi:galactokinase